MFKDRLTDEYMYPILGFDDYSISRSGKIGKCLRVPGNAEKYQDYRPIKTYFRGSELKVKLHKGNDCGTELSVAKLILDSKYGDLPFKIGYRDHDRHNVIGDNLYYIYTKCEIYDSIVVDDMKFDTKVLILSDDFGNFEVFKPLPDDYIYNNGKYWVSSKGAIYNYYDKYLVSRSNDDNRYYKVTLRTAARKIKDTYIQGRWMYVRVHLLVYASWVESNMDGFTIDHLDGRRHNNDVLNLEKVTFQENIRRAHDRNLYDERVIRFKWSTAQVKLVCQMLEQRKLYTEIAEALGIDASDKTSKEYKSVANLCISIRDGRSFQDIAKNYNIPNNTETWSTDYKTPTKFDPEVIRKICEEFVAGKSPKEVIAKYGEIVPSGTIYNIKIGKQYKDVAMTVPGMEAIINSRIRNTEFAVDKGLKVPEKFDKEEYREWRNAERKRLRAAGINREASMQMTSFPEFLPEKYRAS